MPVRAGIIFSMMISTRLLVNTSPRALLPIRWYANPSPSTGLGHAPYYRVRRWSSVDSTGWYIQHGWEEIKGPIQRQELDAFVAQMEVVGALEAADLVPFERHASPFVWTLDFYPL